MIISFKIIVVLGLVQRSKGDVKSEKEKDEEVNNFANKEPSR